MSLCEISDVTQVTEQICKANVVKLEAESVLPLSKLTGGGMSSRYKRNGDMQGTLPF